MLQKHLLFALLIAPSVVHTGVSSPLVAQSETLVQLGQQHPAISQIELRLSHLYGPRSTAWFETLGIESRPASIRLQGQKSGSDKQLTAVLDLARHRLLSIHEEGRSVYEWRGPEAVAHRGSVTLAPENTLAAIHAAIQAQAHRAEIDVRTTSDGQLVLMHDETVDRTSTGSGPVRSQHSSELAKLDAGSWFSDSFQGEPIPTLRQALITMKGRIEPDLDLKDAAPEAVVALLRDLEMLDGATVFAREMTDVRRLLELEPSLAVRPSVPSGEDGLDRLISAVDAPIVNIDWRNFTPDLIGKIHHQGRLAFVNTLGDGDGRERILLALSSGADFIQSDHTELAGELARGWKANPQIGRTLLDAHNAYPYNGRFLDRVSRALASGFPIAIEQDLSWLAEPGKERSIVSHGPPFQGNEPSLERSFFEPVTPLLEQELATGDPRTWPVLILNLDLKTQGDHSSHHQTIEKVLAKYDRFLTVAERTVTIKDVAPLHIGPLLVLTGSSDAQQESFHDLKAPGETIRLFGAAHSQEDGFPHPANNYRRWWNNPWSKVEGEPQPLAGEWLPEENARLKKLVQTAHSRGLWLRFYTLNGHPPAVAPENGWSASYNFGSAAATQIRWHAAANAGVDFIASDQYEALHEALTQARVTP